MRQLSTYEQRRKAVVGLKALLYTMIDFPSLMRY